MLLLRDILQENKLRSYLEEVVLVVVPIYNIGGSLNRSNYSRANQNGPEEHGFRGNAKNLDLNRDFIKCDSKNAQTLNKIFQEWQPDIFIDNHTSNGADYQYTITLVATQHNKLDPHLSAYMNGRLLPKLYEQMAASGWEMTPYVYARSTPDEGIAGFLELPRFSSGYAALFNTLSCMPETHMFKPFADRVQSVRFFMENMIKIAHEDGTAIKAARWKAIENTIKKNTFDLSWELDFTKSDTILFKGYEAGNKKSQITGLDRRYYDRNKPYEKEIPYFNYYKATQSVEKPTAYIIPQAYSEVIERLLWNDVKMKRLKEDQLLEVEMYRVVDFKTRNAYESHYLHYNTEVEKEDKTWQFHKGDYVIFTDQPSNRYIVETLEPHAPDSFFAWNFFDGILSQKEYFSSYVFEDFAAEFLKNHPSIKEELEAQKQEDQEFAKNGRAQLDFIYKRSPWYEPTHRLYPVGRILDASGLGL